MHFLQGLPAMGLDRQAMRDIFTDVANLAAYGSIVAGELPEMGKPEAEDLLAEFGFLGQVFSQRHFDRKDRCVSTVLHYTLKWLLNEPVDGTSTFSSHLHF